MNRLAIFSVIICSLLILAGCGAETPTPEETPTPSPTPMPGPGPTKGGLKVHFIDVGQGDAIVVRTPDRKTILIDTGDKTMRRDYGELVVVPYFKARGIKEIDLLILTHPHADHIGGAQAVMKNLKIDKVLLQRGVKGDFFRKLRELAVRKNFAIQFVPQEKLNRLTKGSHQGVIALLPATGQ